MNLYEKTTRKVKRQLSMVLLVGCLAEYVCRVMRVSPFRYYCDMIFEVMKNGSSLLHWIIYIFCTCIPTLLLSLLLALDILYCFYHFDMQPCIWFPEWLMFILNAEQYYDRIPNFSAADAFRLTGIGRNEFIDIMNRCRSKVWINF